MAFLKAKLCLKSHAHVSGINIETLSLNTINFHETRMFSNFPFRLNVARTEYKINTNRCLTKVYRF